MNKKSIFIKLILSLSAIILIGMSSYADTNEEKVVIEPKPLKKADVKINKNLDNTYSYIDKNGFVHEFYDIKGVKVSIKDAISIPYEDEKTLEDLTPNNFISYQNKKLSILLFGNKVPYQNKVVVNSTSRIIKGNYKMTPYIKGPAQIDYAESRTFHKSINVLLGAEIEKKIFVKIKESARVDIGYFSTTAKHFNLKFPIKSGKVGVVFFSPYYIDGRVTYFNQNGSPINVTAKYPKKINGFADGLYEVIYR